MTVSQAGRPLSGNSDPDRNSIEDIVQPRYPVDSLLHLIGGDVIKHGVEAKVLLRGEPVIQRLLLEHRLHAPRPVRKSRILRTSDRGFARSASEAPSPAYRQDQA
jgi:hypothetical protein